jgi:hypothetical protein
VGQELGGRRLEEGSKLWPPANEKAEAHCLCGGGVSGSSTSQQSAPRNTPSNYLKLSFGHDYTELRVEPAALGTTARPLHVSMPGSFPRRKPSSGVAPLRRRQAPQMVHHR